MNKSKIKVSIILNSFIAILTLAASIIMFTGFKFMGDDMSSLEATKIAMLRFFTVDSNIFMGIMAFVFAIEQILALKGKKQDIPTFLYILKLMSTVAVGLTFLTVVVYLGPISEGGIMAMLKNSNLFFHLIIPVVSMVNFALFERTNKIKFKHVLMGIIPTVVYAVFYLINVLIHTENGRVSTVYDWYWFVQGGMWQIAIVMPLMIGATYLISLLLWRINRK